MHTNAEANRRKSKCGHKVFDQTRKQLTPFLCLFRSEARQKKGKLLSETECAVNGHARRVPVEVYIVGRKRRGRTSHVVLFKQTDLGALHPNPRSKNLAIAHAPGYLNICRIYR
jgi:hypothetical protein